jgi:hypothetical protein
MPHTTHELLDIASNHIDGEEAVVVTLNTPQGKGKQVVDHGEGTSSHFKKKKKNDKCRRDDNFVAAIERKTTRPKGSPTKPALTKDLFKRLLDALCPHHEVPVKHMLRECRLIKTMSKVPSSREQRTNPRRKAPPPTTMTAWGLRSLEKTVRCT